MLPVASPPRCQERVLHRPGRSRLCLRR
jgi:hypothetical protein